MEERAWYILQTYSGCENAAKRNIESRIKTMGMEDCVFNVLVPEEKSFEKKKNGEIREIITKRYPGYVFIDMIVTDDSWFKIRNTPMVTGFLGSSGGGAKPVPMNAEEIGPILKMCGITSEKKFTGEIGDKVRITAGNLNGQEGIIDNIDYQKESVTVLIYAFGRATPTEAGFNEVIILPKD